MSGEQWLREELEARGFDVQAVVLSREEALAIAVGWEMLDVSRDARHELLCEFGALTVDERYYALEGAKDKIRASLPSSGSGRGTGK